MYRVTIIFVALLLSIPALALAADIRDSTGRTVYRTNTRGNVTDVRSATGQLKYKATRDRGGTDVRSPSGQLLYRYAPR